MKVNKLPPFFFFSDWKIEYKILDWQFGIITLTQNGWQSVVVEVLNKNI